MSERVDDGQVVTEAQDVDDRGNATPDDLPPARSDARPVAAAQTAESGIDAALVEEALGGRLEAFNELVRRHQDYMFSLVFRLVPDRDQAADAVQEAFFNAYKHLSSYRGGSVKSWLGRIAINAAMDIGRAQRRRPSQPYPEFEDDSWQPPAGDEEAPETRALGAERSKALVAALEALPIEQRACIVLYDVHGYDYSEIATTMHVEVGTVKSRIHRGRLALRTALAPNRELFRG